MRAPRRSPEPLRLPLGPRAAAVPTWASVVLEVGLVGCSVAVATAWSAGAAWRATAACALVALAAMVHHVASGRRRPAKAWLAVDEHGVHKVDGGRDEPSASTLVVWREPFGATVLASADRARFLVALTSPRATRYLAVRVADGEDAGRAPMLLERATTAADSDLRADDDTALAAADAERLLRELARRAPASLDRVYLSDASGEPVVLDRTELRVGVRRIDLSAPLEWRAFVFQEAGAQAASVCQATWVRQAEAEVVLVAPMAADGNWQASIAEPPPRELRRAIDRLFMLPLRRAIDRAPRISRVPSSPSSRRTEPRA